MTTTNKKAVTIQLKDLVDVVTQLNRLAIRIVTQLLNLAKEEEEKEPTEAQIQEVANLFRLFFLIVGLLTQIVNQL